jgi:hypothetical protein
MPNRASPSATRTPSVHSVASLHSSSRSQSMNFSQVQRQSKSYESDNFSDTMSEDDQTYSQVSIDSAIPAIWQKQRQQPTMDTIRNRSEKEATSFINTVPSVTQTPYQHQRNFAERQIEDDATSRSSTLDGNEEYVPYPAKTSQPHAVTELNLSDQEPASPGPAPHVPGPLESQLAALMSKLIYIEQANPAISVKPDEYQETLGRLKALEEEKKLWWKRHEAIWSLRDEDVENNIKIRVSQCSLND